ncbi:hypothetical protein BDM02DRAFT_2013699 [Thelephora ganbajun]|uniref:Uncharacterized protein n=1 Tax=Thelephora ganbajun TaxID=370292 RepID=A0ACB6ZGP9_THEGA|nr:hypothetical protein BDM02DRAFT_2013699 [Thelephora ganbajun]
MFSLPQSTEPPSQVPIVDVSEPSDILQLFIQHLYPRAPPEVSDLAMWADLYTVADKYNTEVVTDSLRNMLIPWFLEECPMRVYALASHWGFEEEAKIASRGILTMDISKGFPEEEARFMGSVACQKLYLLHIQRRNKARALVNDRIYQFSDGRNCSCPPMDFNAVIQALSQRVSTTPWLTAEELYEEAAGMNNSRMCASTCRNSFKNVHRWMSLILREISQLPQTI